MEPCRKDDEKKVTNLEYLLKLSKGNDAFVKDMIRIFLEENPAEINTLERAIKEHDFRLINSAAHKLRSTVPFVGIDKLVSEDITEIEKLALDHETDQYAGAKKNTSFLPTDKELLQHIEKLFSKVKNICCRAYDELRPFGTA